MHKKSILRGSLAGIAAAAMFCPVHAAAAAPALTVTPAVVSGLINTAPITGLASPKAIIDLGNTATTGGLADPTAVTGLIDNTVSADECRLYNNPRQTLYALNHVCDLAGLEAIFANAPAGNMPGWEKTGRGYARFENVGAISIKQLALAINLLWTGKTFYTDANSGYLYNNFTPVHGAVPPLRLVEAIEAPVYFGIFPADGKPVIVIDYATPLLNMLVDYIREVQPHIFIGVGVNRNTGEHAIDFTLDLTGA